MVNVQPFGTFLTLYSRRNCRDARQQETDDLGALTWWRSTCQPRRRELCHAEAALAR